MAATVTIEEGVIDISGIDADWTWSDLLPQYPDGIPVVSIQFIPGAQNNEVVIKSTDENGGEIFRTAPAASTSDQKIEYFNLGGNGYKFLKPFIDYDQCTLSAGHRVKINMMV